MTEGSLSSPPEKRHYPRQPINAYVKLDEDNGGVIVDASEAGLRVRAVRELEAGRSVRMRFQLNRTYIWTEAKGRIVWTSHTKKLAGIGFSGPPNAAREVLRGLLREASWRHASNPGVDNTELPPIKLASKRQGIRESEGRIQPQHDRCDKDDYCPGHRVWPPRLAE